MKAWKIIGTAGISARNNQYSRSMTGKANYLLASNWDGDRGRKKDDRRVKKNEVETAPKQRKNEYENEKENEKDKNQ
jgi:hypothetical protein